MSKITELDKTLIWEIPIVKRGGNKQSGSRVGERFLTISLTKKNEEKKIKWDNVYLKFNQDVLNKYFPPNLEGFKVGFSFDEIGKRLIIVFNPTKGIPFYNLSKSGSTRLIYNTILIQKIYNFLGLNTDIDKYHLKIHYFAKINGNELYCLTPYDYQTITPLWEDEINGKLDFN